MAAQLTVIPNCIPLVQFLANKTQDPTEAFSAGLCGLEIAIRYFNLHKGRPFVSFAYGCILQSITGLTSEKQKLAKRIKIIQNLFYQKTGNHLSPEQLSTILGEDAAKIRDLLRTDNVLSLDLFSAAIREGKLSLPADESVPPPYNNELEESFVAEAVEKILQTLPDEDAQIVKLYFGLNLPCSYTYEQIASMFNLTTEAIRLRMIKILEKLSANRRLKELHFAEA